MYREGVGATTQRIETEYQRMSAVKCARRWATGSPRLAQISLPWQQGLAPHSARFHWTGHLQKPPSRPKHVRSICHTIQLIGDFVPILRSKFLGVRGVNQKSKNKVLESSTWITYGQKMVRFHRETKKEEAIWSLCDRQTEIETDR